MDSISLEELSYLSLCRGFLEQDVKKAILDALTPQYESATQLQKERFVLAFPEQFQLNTE